MGESGTKAFYSTNAENRSLNDQFSMELAFLILDKITEPLPTNDLDVKTLRFPTSIELAGVNFHKCNIVFPYLQIRYSDG